MDSFNTRTRQTGVTLIEVLVGTFLTAILVMGVVGLWAMVDEQFLKLQYRQKAIFIANGEMARLSALGRHTDFFNLSSAFEDDTPPRWIYRDNPIFTGTPPTSLVVTETLNSNVAKADLAENQIWFMDTDGTNDADTEFNVVWLDRDNDVTARLEWDVTATGTTCLAPGCFIVELRLSYPYRFVEGSDPSVDNMGRIDNDTITLRTIVGPRQ